jgi:hypothetical protein
MIGYIILAVGVGAIIGLAIAAYLDRATAKAPPANVTPGICVLGVDMSGSGAVEIDPRYARMVKSVLEQPARGNGFRTLI